LKQEITDHGEKKFDVQQRAAGRWANEAFIRGRIFRRTRTERPSWTRCKATWAQKKKRMSWHSLKAKLERNLAPDADQKPAASPAVVSSTNTIKKRFRPRLITAGPRMIGKPGLGIANDHDF